MSSFDDGSRYPAVERERCKGGGKSVTD
jgi:hypothetical protein